jgi:hypothetical protein
MCWTQTSESSSISRLHKINYVRHKPKGLSPFCIVQTHNLTYFKVE